MKGLAILMGAGKGPPKGVPAAPGTSKADVDRACREFVAHPSCDALKAMLQLEQDYSSASAEGETESEYEKE